MSFICPGCHREVTDDARHTEKPEVCFLCYTSQADRELIEQAVDDACSTVEYERGFQEGYRDACVIALPIKTGEHTLSNYQAITARYEAAIYAMPPTSYERGYGDGFDKKALEMGFGKEECDAD